MESQPPPRWLLQRPLPVSVLALGTIAALIAGFVWTNRLVLAENAAVAMLREIGVTPARLTIDSLTLGGATVSNITLGAQRIARIEAAYTLSGLRRGQFGRVRASNVRVQARWRDGVLTLPGLTAPMKDSSDGAAIIGAIEVDGYRVTLDTADGEVILEGGRAEADFADGDGGILADVTVRAAGNHVAGSLEATLFSGGEILGRYSVRDGNITAPHGSAEGLRGEVQIIFGAGLPELDAGLDVARLVIGGREIQNARISIAAAETPDNIVIDGQLKSPAGQARLRGYLSLTAQGGARFDGTGAVSLAVDGVQAALSGGLRLARTPRGDLSGTLDIETARLGYNDISLRGVAGIAAFTLPRSGEPTLDATLEFQRLTAPSIDGQPGTLAIKLDRRGIAARGELTTPDGRLTLEARGRPGEALDFKTEGKLAIGPLLVALKSGIQGRGTLAFDLAGTVANPLDFPASLVDALRVTGTVDAALDDIAVPAQLRGGAVRGNIDLSLRPGEWRIASDGLRLSAASLAKDILIRLPGAVRDRLGDGVRVAVNGPATLLITQKGDRHAAQLRGAIRLDVKDASLAVRGTLDYTGAAWNAAGRYTLDAAHRGAVAGFPAPLTLQAGMTGGFTLADNVLTIDAGPESRVTITEITVPDLARTASPLMLAPAKALRARVLLSETPRLLAFEGAIAVAEHRLAVTAGTVQADIDVAPFIFRINGAQDGFQLTMEDGALALPAYDIHAKGIALALRMDAEAEFALAIDEISQGGANPLVVPLRLNLTATRRGKQIEFAGRLIDAPERLLIRATGRYGIATGNGAVSADIDPITFLPTVLQPRQLFPVLGERLREVDGRIGGHANLQWVAGELRSSGEIFAELQSLKIEGAAVENAAATITFDSLFPLSTPPNQEIHIGLLDIGVPMTKGRIEFQIGRGGPISAALRELDLFGGRIETEKVTIPSSLDGFSVPLQVKGVQLESLFALTEIGDLEATGSLDGILPLVVENGAIALRLGVLKSAPGGGVIRYRPKSIGPALSGANEGAALFLKLVHDFNYDSVRVTLDEDPSGGVASRFEIKGRNKAVYDGIPVELNISMSGPLRDILNQTVKTFTLPGRLLKRLQQLPSGN